MLICLYQWWNPVEAELRRGVEKVKSSSVGLRMWQISMSSQEHKLVVCVCVLGLNESFSPVSYPTERPLQNSQPSGPNLPPVRFGVRVARSCFLFESESSAGEWVRQLQGRRGGRITVKCRVGWGRERGRVRRSEEEQWRREIKVRLVCQLCPFTENLTLCSLLTLVI